MQPEELLSLKPNRRKSRKQPRGHHGEPREAVGETVAEAIEATATETDDAWANALQESLNIDPDAD
eukprot:11186923-Lingulodinium_polyedra.AAC.1